jgi:rubrerythrin
VAFSSLDEILAFAVAREVEAAAFYGDLAGRARTESLRVFLQGFEEEELRHKVLLEMYRAGAPVPPPGTPVPDMGMTATAADECYDPAASVQDALIVAVRKESRAIDLYGRLAAAAADSESRKLFEFLTRQEMLHKFRLENEYEAHVLSEG